MQIIKNVLTGHLVGQLLVHFVLLPFWMSSCFSAESVDWKSRFLKEYPEAASKIEKATSSLQMVSERIIMNSTGNIVENINYFSDIHKYRIDFSREEGAEESSEKAGEDVIVLTPNGRFKLYRQGGHKDYQVDGINTGSQSSYLEKIRLSNPLPFSSHCIFEISIIEFMRKPDFEVIKVEEVQQNNKLLIKIHWQFSYIDQGNELGKKEENIAGGWILLSPEENWVLYEYLFHGSINLYPNTGLNAVVEYSDIAIDGVPIPKAVTIFRYTEGKRGDIAFKTEAIKITPQKANASLFQLSAFGIPDGLLSGGRNTSPWIYYLLIGNGLIIVIVIALYVLKTMRNKKTLE